MESLIVTDQLSETCKCGTRICVDHSGKFLFRFDTEVEGHLRRRIDELTNLIPIDRSDEIYQLNRQIASLEMKAKRQEKLITKLKKAINEGEITVIIK